MLNEVIMPTYDYMCDSCGYTFEAQHKMTDDPVRSCPSCGQSVHQVFSAGFGLNFTGKGFYQTDTRKSAGATKAEKTDTSTASSGQSETAIHSCSGSCGCSGGCSCSAQ